VPPSGRASGRVPLEGCGENRSSSSAEGGGRGAPPKALTRQLSSCGKAAGGLGARDGESDSSPVLEHRSEAAAPSGAL